jgi:hypothetical protein
MYNFNSCVDILKSQVSTIEKQCLNSVKWSTCIPIAMLLLCGLLKGLSHDIDFENVDEN